MTDKILIVGAGRVGQALASNLKGRGYEVVFATRGAVGNSLGIGGAAAGFRLVILAVPFAAVGDVVSALGLENGAVLIDATNPFGKALSPEFGSGAELVASKAGVGVKVVKAFNVLGAEHMISPELPDGHKPVLPVAGDDPVATAEVVQLARSMGFDALPVGGLKVANILEQAALYWALIAQNAARGRGVVLVADQREPR